ncbi:MAG: DUF302 domain-containing protein [Lentisphaeria bacterium]|nr:DUF302 domain-containing protein [Lentisphaeria bacterium]
MIKFFIDTDFRRSFSEDSPTRRLSFFSTLFGLLGSAVLVAVLNSGCASMPRVLGGEADARCRVIVTVHESKYQNVDQTCEALKSAIVTEGLSFLKLRNTNKSIVKGGLHLDRQVRVIEWCKTEYAYEMLKKNPEVSALFPCTFGVYEGDDGKIYVSALNMTLMGEVFGGVIADVMGERVAKIQTRILAVHTR